MTTLIVALLIAFGLILVAIELFLVPGFSVPGIAGITMIGYGIFRAGKMYGFTGVISTIAVSAIVSILLIRTALKSRTIKSLGLEYSHKGTSAVDDYSSLLGKTGTSLSDLRPSGTAIIEGKRFDVVTDGEYIDKNSPVIVDRIEGTRIILTLNGKG